MNKFEKEAIKMLSKEEREKIVGGTAETDELSEEQCAQLREVWIKTKAQESPFVKITTDKLPALMMYGGREPGISAKKLYDLINDDKNQSTDKK